MSFYRDVYLKSQDWKNLRAAILARDENTCQVCNLYSPQNDVHHIQYRKLYNVKPEDLVVLCRSCHDNVHKMLKALPKTKHKLKRWKSMRKSLLKDRKKAVKQRPELASMLSRLKALKHRLRKAFYTKKRALAEANKGENA